MFTAAVGETTTSMQLKVNGNVLDNFTYAAIGDPILAREDFFIGNVSVPSANILVNLTYDNNGNPSSVGYLDYISIEATRGLIHSGNQFIFKNND